MDLLPTRAPAQIVDVKPCITSSGTDDSPHSPFQPSENAILATSGYGRRRRTHAISVPTVCSENQFATEETKEIKWYSSIRFKSSLVHFIVVAALILTLGVLSYTSLIVRFERLEKQSVENGVLRMTRTINGVVQTACRQSLEHALWNDTITFLLTGELSPVEHGIHSNFVVSQLIHHITYLSLDYKIGVSWTADPQTFMPIAPPPSLQSFDEGHPLMALWDHEAEDPLTGLLRGSRSGLIYTPEHGPLVVACSPLVDFQQGVQIGWAIVGTYLQSHLELATIQVCAAMKAINSLDSTSELARGVSRISSLIDVHAPPEPLGSEYVRVSTVNNLNDGVERMCGETMENEAQRTSGVAGYFILQGVTEADNYATRIDIARSVYMEGLTTIDHVLVVTGVLGTVIVLCMLLMMEFTLVRPLISIAYELEDVARGKCEFIRSAQSYMPDEVSYLRNRINWMLSKVAEAKTVFIASFTHELRNPLNAVMGVNSLLAESETLHQEEKEMLSLSQQSASHLLNLITNILDHSKIITGNLTLDTRWYKIGNLVEEVAEMFAPVVNEKTSGHVEIVADVSKDLFVTGFGDQMRLKQVLINLVSNSVKFTSAGHIIVSSCLVDRIEEGNKFLVRFSVKDSGIGIEENELDRVFLAFSQLRAGRRKPGTGLGLSISKQLVKMFGGEEISVTSNGIGKGAEFFFTIPICVNPMAMVGSFSSSSSSTPAMSRENSRTPSCEKYTPRELAFARHTLYTPGSYCVLVMSPHAVVANVVKRYIRDNGIQTIEEVPSATKGVSGRGLILAVVDEDVRDRPMSIVHEYCLHHGIPMVALRRLGTAGKGPRTKESRHGLVNVLFKPVRRKHLEKNLERAMVSYLRHERGENDRVNEGTGDEPSGIDRTSSATSAEIAEVVAGAIDRDPLVQRTHLRRIGVLPSDTNPRRESETTRRWVLIVDDNAMNRKIVGRMLKETYLWEEASSGSEALSKIRDRVYDVVLMDNFMPEMDGIEATQRLRALEEELHRPPCIVFGFSANDEDDMKWTENGMNGFISKPTTKDVLLRQIEASLL